MRVLPPSSRRLSLAISRQHGGTTVPDNLACGGDSFFSQWVRVGHDTADDKLQDRSRHPLRFAREEDINDVRIRENLK